MSSTHELQQIQDNSNNETDGNSNIYIQCPIQTCSEQETVIGITESTEDMTDTTVEDTTAESTKAITTGHPTTVELGTTTTTTGAVDTALVPVAGKKNGQHTTDLLVSVTSSLQKLTLKERVLTLMVSCMGEIFGTFMLTLIICTVVAAAVITEAQQGIWQVALPSGLGVAVSIFLSAHISDAHLNPAVTLAFGVVRFRQFHWSYIIPYILSQFVGAVIAGTFVFIFYHGAIDNFEEIRNITRGEDGSELTAMLFGEYFPNPSLYDHADSLQVTSLFEAFLVEAWGTLILVFVIFSITHPDNTTVGGNKAVIPLIVAFTVACLISVYGPLTQAGLNPARDFGPRVVAAIAGWGKIAIPGPRNGFWVYILGPLVGGLAGGGLSDLVFYCARRFKKV